MNTLFPVEPVFPEGFSYYADFINKAEAEALLTAIKQIELHPFTFQGYQANRKIASFGFDYSFADGKLKKGKDIPKEFDFLIEKVSKKISVSPASFAELLVTEYPPGSVINWHRDAPPFDLIAGISLSADSTFKLRPYNKALQTRSSTISFVAQQRSLYIMAGQSRTDWQHSISPVKATRYSITLRTLK